MEQADPGRRGLGARMLAISLGYEDADYLDTLCDDPGFKVALSKLLGNLLDPASQPPMIR